MLCPIIRKLDFSCLPLHINDINLLHENINTIKCFYMLVKKDKNKTAQCKFKPLNFHFLDLIPYLLRQALLYIILHSIMMFGSVFYTGGLSELLQMCYTLPNRGSLSYFMKFAY